MARPGIDKMVLNRIEVRRGDITRLGVDAIVNAANTTLLGGGGVATDSTGAVYVIQGASIDKYAP